MIHIIYKKELQAPNFEWPVLLLISRSVVSDSLRFHIGQHARLLCPSPSPRDCSNSCPLSRWCHPTISASVVPFSCLQSDPASGSFPMNQFFTSGGQSIGVSASTLVLPMNTQDWSPSGWTGWISLQSKGLSRVFSNSDSPKAVYTHCCSVPNSCPSLCDPRGLQHSRLLCSSPSPWVCPSSCPLNWWCHPTISCSVTFFFCPQSFPASGSFSVSWLFALGGQQIGASASASSVFPMNIQGWFPLGLIGLISLLSKGLLRVFSSTTEVRKHQSFSIQPSLRSNSNIHTWLLENHSFDYMKLCL